MEPIKEKEVPKKESPKKEKENEKSNSSEKTEKNPQKINLPKRKYAIIHGYFGQDYSGNTKNPGVHTVEEELENALYKEKFISPCNYGNLKKVNWMRASRTDKGVSAIMNVVSVKLHKYPDIDEIDMKNKLNKVLPKDIKIFRIIEVSDHFDSKDNNNNREYHYIIPTFVFEKKKKKENDDEKEENNINEE